MTKMFGSEGVKAIDISAPNGDKLGSIAADKNGFLNVEDKATVQALKAEGFAVAGLYSGLSHVKGNNCTGCGFSSVFKVFDCPKCGVKNDHSN
jgi:hypothetical protein